MSALTVNRDEDRLATASVVWFARGVASSVRA